MSCNETKTKSPTRGIMATDILLRQHEAERVNWWIGERRRLFASIVSHLDPNSTRTILEIGPGAGSNLDVLCVGTATHVVVADADEVVLQMCSGRGYGSSVQIDASALPFADSSFEFLLAADVLEHVEKDKQAAIEICRVLATGAQAVVTVPAFMSLWSEHDRRAGHQRRYSKRELHKLFADQDVRIRELAYFNWFLFAPTFLIKFALKVARPTAYADATIVPNFLNRLLSAIFRMDIWIARHVTIPFGVSLLIVLERP